MSKLEQMQKLVEILEAQRNMIATTVSDMPTELKDALLHSFETQVSLFKFLVRLYAKKHIKTKEGVLEY